MKAGKKIQIGLVVCLLLISTAGIGIIYYKERSDQSMKNTLRSLAYGKKEADCIIYCKENGRYEPYLVLTSDYHGAALLLRKEVLSEERQYSEHFGYYKDSLIDRYLTSEFFEQLEPELQKKIIPMDISITSMESLAVSGEQTEQIKRTVFLPAASELGICVEGCNTEEGQTLRYFKDQDHRAATRNGVAAGWWLRSSYTVYESTACAITPDNRFDGIGVEAYFGVRPAFCLDGELKVKKSNEVRPGEEVYVLDLN